MATVKYTAAFAELEELFEDYSNTTLIAGANDDALVYQGGPQLKVVVRGEGLESSSTVSAGHVESITFRSDDGDVIARIEGLNLSVAENQAIFQAHPGDIEGLVKLALSGNDQIVGSGRGEALYGYGGNDRIRGNNGDDEIDGGGGRDRLTGGRGSDDFIFGARYGKDVITDFDATGGGRSQDYIVFTMDTEIRLIRQGNDTLIRYGNGGEILLENVKRSDVDLGVDIVYAL
jgi:Ca2+-binding RTX toxin-like protein